MLKTGWKDLKMKNCDRTDVMEERPGRLSVRSWEENRESGHWVVFEEMKHKNILELRKAWAPKIKLQNHPKAR